MFLFDGIKPHPNAFPNKIRRGNVSLRFGSDCFFDSLYKFLWQGDASITFLWHTHRNCIVSFVVIVDKNGSNLDRSG